MAEKRQKAVRKRTQDGLGALARPLMQQIAAVLASGLSGHFARLLRYKPLKTGRFPAGLRLAGKQTVSDHFDPVYGGSSYKMPMTLLRFIKYTLLAALLPGLLACASIAVPNYSSKQAALREGAYRLDPDHAALLFKINHLGLSTYMGRFNTFSVVLDFDPENPAQASLEAVIEVASLDVNNSPFAKTLTGPNWFDAAAYPQARFISREIEITGENTGLARGELTLKGVTRPLTMEITFNGGANNLLTNAYTIGFDAKTSFNRSDYGIKRFVGLVGDRVELEFYGEFQRKGRALKDQ